MTDAPGDVVIGARRVRRSRRCPRAACHARRRVRVRRRRRSRRQRSSVQADRSSVP
jgi:hypothetical protein